MIQATCPSCGAPVVFAHADALTAACERCRSLVVRTDREVQAIGRVSAFDRDLSPVQLEASGVWGSRRFRVVGVVRLGRERVRWNEWALAFEDGATGWLGESNGQHWLFEGEGEPAGDVRSLDVGESFSRAGGVWVVLEAGTARIVAAEGSLWWRPPADLTRRYADVRRRGGGGVGTVDFEDPKYPRFYAGRATTLVELRMEGLRPVTGWDDPALTHFRGAELHAVRKLDCPACGAGLEIKAANLSERVVCGYCGTATDLDGGSSGAGVEPAARSPRPLWGPRLPLGTRGKLGGVEWQIVGAMERSVRVEGVRYPWTEYFLYNPWRGGLWLVEANGHWSRVELLADLPEASDVAAKLGDRAYRAFQSGSAKVDRVLGEFTWQVAVGDISRTRDYVCEGWMLSREDADGERTWSLGEYVERRAVEAFAGQSLPPAVGVAPHQPNPVTSAVLAVNLASAGVVAAIAVIGSMFLNFFADDETTPVVFRQLTASAVAVAPYEVPDVLRRDTRMDLLCNPRSTSGVVSLVHQPTGNVYEQSWTDGETRPTEWRLEPGPYTVRLELAEATGVDITCTLRLVRDEPGGIIRYGTMVAAAAAAFSLVRRSSFEQKRNQESSFT